MKTSETIPLVRRPRRARPSKPAVSSPQPLSKIGQQPDPAVVEAVDVVPPLVGVEKATPANIKVSAPVGGGGRCFNRGRVRGSN